ncbi:HAD superfamily hydrolase (TIGR01509 family) [Actinoalloteichus hoggarensis]|uniref:(S)-2-haloacid dehalogenase 4A n=1 Tax=Actinoalloteichus hoggarensis TaxID=1470176 RepID=A0A221VXL8_9PSEU|nr:HAD-IA family hydrolase [Actinoalloteichus hoggarensis]ASO18001.1 (S)-2-haloacid dehalogenase 4A [Actinoalloteichus hoggarensis]MBB5924413.1 HAD superfamily hydrolase (TIGR01509 family) [Actinoalloteichus hoggarensis]
MAIRGVLFDFSGTLFRLEPGPAWFRGLTPGEVGSPLSEDAEAELIVALTAPAGEGAGLPASLADAWRRRDLDPVLHRTVYEAIITGAGIDEELATPLYHRLIHPDYWRAYPDTAPALRGLRAAGVGTAVVSNIVWDVRAALARIDAAELVDEYVLSYVEGAMKPDRRLFAIACDRLGIAPEEALMIGDSPEADGAAAELGCRVEIVPPLRTDERPAALVAALRRHGLRTEPA